MRVDSVSNIYSVWYVCLDDKDERVWKVWRLRVSGIECLLWYVVCVVVCSVCVRC